MQSVTKFIAISAATKLYYFWDYFSVFYSTLQCAWEINNSPITSVTMEKMYEYSFLWKNDKIAQKTYNTATSRTKDDIQ